MLRRCAAAAKLPLFTTVAKAVMLVTRSISGLALGHCRGPMAPAAFRLQQMVHRRPLVQRSRHRGHMSGTRAGRSDSLGETMRPPQFPSRRPKRWHRAATVEWPERAVILRRSTEIGEQSGNKPAASGVFGYVVPCNFCATRVDMRFSLAQPGPEFHFYCGLVALWRTLMKLRDRAMEKSGGKAGTRALAAAATAQKRIAATKKSAPTKKPAAKKAAPAKKPAAAKKPAPAAKPVAP